MKVPRLVSNLFNQIILYGFSHCIPFILMPYLLSTIGVGKYGVINIALAFGTYFQVINEFGFDLSNVRRVVEHRNNKTEISKILSNIIQCKVVLLCLSGVLYFIIVLSVSYLHEYLLVYVLVFIRMCGIIISPYWLFRSMEDVKYVTRVSTVIKIICILPIFAIVHTPSDYWKVVMCYCAETTVGGMVALYIALKRYNLHLSKSNAQTITEYFKDSWVFFKSTFLVRIYQSSNVVLLGFCVGDVVAGIYTAAEKLYRAYSAFVSPLISYVFYPYFSRIKDFKRIKRIILFIVGFNIIILMILFAFSDNIIPLFIKTKTPEIISYFNLFLFLLIFSVPNDLLGFPFLGVMGLVNQVNKSTYMAAFTYFGIAIILIICKCINAINLIYLLALTNMVSLTARILFIRNANRKVIFND